MDNFNFIKRKEKKHSIDNCQFSSMISNHLDKRLPIYSHWLSPYFLLSPRINQRRRERKGILFYFFFQFRYRIFESKSRNKFPAFWYTWVFAKFVEVGTLKMAPRGHCSSRVRLISISNLHVELISHSISRSIGTKDEDGDQGNLVTGNNLKQGNINVKLYFLISCNMEIVIFN